MPNPSLPEAEAIVPFENKEPQVAPFPIVGMGASAGGLEAFSKFLEALPADTGMAFVLIQHLDPAHKSELTAILSRSTSMKVSEVRDGMAVEPNHVYVIPPNTALQFVGQSFHLTPRPADPMPPLTIDHFFRSLASEQSRLSIGVVLSGTGSDGTEGLKAIKSVCGITFAQDELSAKYPSMPRSATATGIVDFVMAPGQIAEELARISRDQYVVPPSGDRAEEILPEGATELREIFSLLLRGTGVDFTHYKEPTIRRRIGRRLVVHRLAGLGEYVSYLRKHPEELKELYRDFLINVTSFFRDPETFAALAAEISRLIRKKEFNGSSFRAWIPGCSTGEEIYSLAICMQEVFEEAGLRPDFQFFGTDISEGALEVARAGYYPERIVEEVSSERLNRYFRKSDGKYQISKVIREVCVFARHDVTRDTPFSHLDLISCRNLLIYLDPVLQKGVLPTFHYGLNPTGLLLLGTAETVSSAPELFTMIDPKHKLFLRKPASTRLNQYLTWHPRVSDSLTQTQVKTAVESQSVGKRVDRVIRDRYAPDAVVIDGDWQILQFRGQTGFYLEPAPGDASYHLLRMARGDLPYLLRELVANAIEQGALVERTGIRVEQGGEAREITLEVLPLEGASDSERFYLVVFKRVATQRIEVSGGPSMLQRPEDIDQRVAQLQRELVDTRSFHRAVSEEHDAAMEEVRAINEELRSANEELQSSNEELGTTKEELQSSNEELTTVNEELGTRNQQLGLLNDDLNNLFAAATSPILKLDRDLVVRRISPAAEKLGVSSADLNHPVRDLQLRLGTLPQIELLIRGVIEKLVVQTYDFQDRKNCWWTLAIRPYRTTDDRIDGAVLTFTDTDSIQQALEESQKARRYADAIVETVREPLLILTPDLKVERANASFYKAFHTTAAQTQGQLVYDLAAGQWNIPQLRRQLEEVLPTKSSFANFEVKYTLPDSGPHVLLLNARQIEGADDIDAILLTFEDITELDRTKEELRALAGSLMNAREEADRAISRELHDDFSQRLGFLEMTIERNRLGSVGRTSREVDELLATLQGHIAQLSNDLRNLSHRMHPDMLDHLGLVVALQSMVEEMAGVRSAPVRFTHGEIPAGLPLPYASAAYRIAQGALSNATKHAPGAPVTISLTAKAGLLRLSISDSGPGFDVAAVRGKGGLGIVSMQERARPLGGRLHIQSEPDKGTAIVLEIPLPPESSV